MPPGPRRGGPPGRQGMGEAPPPAAGPGGPGMRHMLDGLEPGLRMQVPYTLCQKRWTCGGNLLACSLSPWPGVFAHTSDQTLLEHSPGFSEAKLREAEAFL